VTSSNRPSNILQLYIIKLSKWLMLTMPIVFLFYQENGLGTQDLFILKAAYSLAIVILEIPSGYIGDIWGRKNSMIIGSLLGPVGFSVYCFASGFYGFLIAELILGIGQSFISGSDSALLYDSLLVAKKDNQHLKTEGRMISIGNYAEAVAAPIGVALAAASLRTPFFFQVLIAFTAVPAAFMLKEPPVKRLASRRISKNMGEIITYVLKKNKTLKWNIMLSTITGVATLTMTWLIQPLFVQLAIPLALYGIIIPALNLTAGTASIYAYAVEKKIGFERAIFAIVTGVSVMYLGIGLSDSMWVIIFLILFYIIRGVAAPVLKNRTNMVTPSEIRATVLSLNNLMIRLLFIIFSPVIGWYSDHSCLSVAIISSGTFILIAGIFVSLKLINHNKENCDDLCENQTIELYSQS